MDACVSMGFKLLILSLSLTNCPQCHLCHYQTQCCCSLIGPHCGYNWSLVVSTWQCYILPPSLPGFFFAFPLMVIFIDVAMKIIVFRLTDLLNSFPDKVEQLHKIFKLCGSPSEEYWKKYKLPNATLFKPQQPYKRCVAETFKDFPPSSLPLIESLLSVDPDERGTTTTALNSEVSTLYSRYNFPN